jgi:hypothetical protein
MVSPLSNRQLGLANCPEMDHVQQENKKGFAHAVKLVISGGGHVPKKWKTERIKSFPLQKQPICGVDWAKPS